MKRGESNKASFREGGCPLCPSLTGMHSQARTKSVAMDAGRWGMCAEIPNALLVQEQFGKGLLKDLKEEWKGAREILSPYLKAKRGAKEKGALLSVI